MRLYLTLSIILLATSPLLSQKKPLVVASASMLADIAEQIGGAYIDVEMIVPIGGDPHLHEPTPGDVRLVARGDLILVNGLTFEGWITELIDNSGTKAQTITVTEGIDVLTSQTYKNSADPHAWMDASNGIIYAQNIAKALSSIDPEHTEYYSERLESYSTELQELDSYISKAIQSIPAQQRILITSHDAFQYYGKRYGIQLEAIMGISTEAEAQTSDIIRVNKVIKENKVPAVFVESTINPKLIKQLASDNKIKIGGKLYADSLGDIKSPASTYIDMLRYNTDTIVAALSQSTQSDTEDHEKSETNYTFLWILGIGLLLALGLLVYKMNN